MALDCWCSPQLDLDKGIEDEDYCGEEEDELDGDGHFSYLAYYYLDRVVFV